MVTNRRRVFGIRLALIASPFVAVSAGQICDPQQTLVDRSLRVALRLDLNHARDDGGEQTVGCFRAFATRERRHKKIYHIRYLFAFEVFAMQLCNETPF
jgi:hypothetical protein